LGKENYAWTLNASLLAELCTRLGRGKEALDLYLQVIDATTSILGQEHPSSLPTLTGASRCYRTIGWLKEAEALGMQVLETAKKLLLQE
ncbi:hypothetical protein P154DRAFT_379980, partial [Amniculicola lignicola CBS 123094]